MQNAAKPLSADTPVVHLLLIGHHLISPDTAAICRGGVALKMCKTEIRKMGNPRKLTDVHPFFREILYSNSSSDFEANFPENSLGRIKLEFQFYLKSERITDRKKEKCLDL